MLTILVCLFQISVIATIAGTAAKLFMARAPQLSARFCSLAMMLSTAVVLLTIFAVPRLWTLHTSTVATKKANRLQAENRTLYNAALEETSARENSFQLGMTANRLLGHLGQLQSQHRVINARMAFGMTSLATIVVLVFATRSLLGMWWLRRLRTAKPLPESSTAVDELKALQSTAGIRHAMRLCESAEIASPCISWFSPGTIYVPSDFECWSTEERLATLAHELAHEVRRDPQRRLLADLCLTLVYFHPLMLMLRKQLVFAQELATDRLAAQLLGSLSRYRRGLSLLALRMDSQCHQFSLVSVSNNEVIRRIKMLNLNQPKLRRWQEIVSVSAVAIALVFSAAWTATADDTVRIASNKKLDAKQQHGSTQSETVAPWERLGPQEGYVQLRPRLLSQHPILKQRCEDFESQIAGVVNLAEVGLGASEINLVQAPIVVTLTQVPKDQQKDGKKHSLSLGADAIAVDTVNPVAWNDVAALIPESMLPPVALAWIKTELRKFNGSNQMTLISGAAESRSDLHLPQLQALWEQIDDCAVAVAFSQVDAVKQDIGDGELPAGVRTLIELTDSAAVGIYITDGEPTQTIRVSFCPTASATADELAAHMNTMLGSLVEFCDAGIPQDDAEPLTEADIASIKQLVSDVETVQFSVVRTSGGIEVVAAEMTTESDWFPLFKLP